MTKICVVIALLIALMPTFAAAHRLHESYVYFAVSEDSLTGRFEATLEDIDEALGIDDDGDGEVTEAELRTHADRVFDFFRQRLALSYEGQDYAIVATDVTTLGSAVGRFAQMHFDVPDLTEVPDAIEIEYIPLADVQGSGHNGFILIESNTRLQLEDNERYFSLVFDEGDGPQTLSLDGEPPLKLFIDFIAQGVWHIWLGFDHVAFLITLLLPAAMLALAGRWAPEESFRTALWKVVKIATVFTLSHSVTLSLAALGIIQLPVMLVESVIAVSIAAVALMNLFPNTHRYMIWVVFAFGLFHGFGFANVLAPLGLAPTQLIIGLAAFNIGVELGQIAIIMVAFPILWLIRRWSLYPPVALTFGSFVMIALAGVWLLERTTEFEWNVRATFAFLTGGAV